MRLNNEIIQEMAGYPVHCGVEKKLFLNKTNFEKCSSSRQGLFSLL